MIAYFGKDEIGYYIDAENTGERQYINQTLWMELVRAGAHAGADITTNPIRLKIIEQCKIEKFDLDGNLVEIVEGTPETTDLL